MIRWFKTNQGKQPFTLAQVIELPTKGKKGKITFFKVFPYRKLLLMDLEPLSYEMNNYDNLVKKDSFIWLNAETWADKSYFYSPKKEKTLFFNEHGGIICFKGQVISNYKHNFWIDSHLPIQLINLFQNKKIPPERSYLEKKTNGLRVGNIIKFKETKEKLLLSCIEKLSSWKIETPKIY